MCRRGPGLDGQDGHRGSLGTAGWYQPSAAGRTASGSLLTTGRVRGMPKGVMARYPGVCDDAAAPVACGAGPLEGYAARFDDLFGSLAQRRGFREYQAGLLAPRDRNKTLTALAGAEPVAGAGHRSVQQAGQGRTGLGRFPGALRHRDPPPPGPGQLRLLLLLGRVVRRSPTTARRCSIAARTWPQREGAAHRRTAVLAQGDPGGPRLAFPWTALQRYWNAWSNAPRPHSYKP